MMNTWERDFIAEIRFRIRTKQPVSAREKQIVLDLVRREGVIMSAQARAAAERQGFDTQGITSRD